MCGAEGADVNRSLTPEPHPDTSWSDMTSRAAHLLSPLTTVETTRRRLLAMAAVGGVGAAGAAGVATAQPARAAANGKPDHVLTVLGTTDLHGNVYNWDYFKNAIYDDTAHNDIGVAKAATLIRMLRDELGAGNTLTLDAGDTIQGTPLAYYFAKIEPITQGTMHPMATAMNASGYDAAALGNHEFNYGLDLLRTFQSQCLHPLLSANTVDWNSGAPIFPPYLIKTVQLHGTSPIRVGILGLVTPGVAIWDKANVEGKAKFPGIVEQAKIYVPRLKAAGADVVNMFFDGWYKDLDTAARTATNDLMFGRIKADAFCANIQKKADEIKKDDSITKFKH